MDRYFKITVAYGAERVTAEALAKVHATAADVLPTYRLGTADAVRSAKADYDAGVDSDAAEDYRRAEVAINNSIAAQRLGGQVDLVLEPA